MNRGLPAPANRPCRVAPSALALLESARHGLADAGDTPDPGGRYVAAHLAALRAAAAVVAGGVAGWLPQPAIRAITSSADKITKSVRLVFINKFPPSA